MLYLDFNFFEAWFNSSHHNPEEDNNCTTILISERDLKFREKEKTDTNQGGLLFMTSRSREGIKFETSVQELHSMTNETVTVNKYASTHA